MVLNRREHVYAMIDVRWRETMSESKRTSKAAFKNRSSANKGQAIKRKTPQGIFEQLIGKADHLPPDLSTKQSSIQSHSV